MNPRLSLLQPYPFEKLAALFQGTKAAAKSPILWSIGEPKHEAPAFVHEIINKELSGLSNYPLTAGLSELREAIADWLSRRFCLKRADLDRDKHVLPVNGTREALFAFCQFIVDARKGDALVLMPNPFYQIYEGAAFLADAEPWYMNLNHENLPDFDAVPEEIWKRCQLIYISSPGNPSGAVISSAEMQKLIRLSDQFDFAIASDECYSEIYPDESKPPCGLLQAAAEMGRTDFKNCVVFHSLSKRSSLPGMRSGFVAGDAELIKNFKLYRTYHGCAMSPPFQKASVAAWQDEVHVVRNRDLYRQKFELVIQKLKGELDLEQPGGAFYLWPKTPFSDTEFARLLFNEQNLTVLPGSYLSREFQGSNPGKNRVRMALVAPLSECADGAERLKEFLVSAKERAK
ncbi:MAG: succinyldiaminopimelate transaminase [Candidatus Obscuribacterales bacterium]|nr:succinyldiaminopimelate transaminase [Candidatus Obscuribacterales bacterium]